MTETTQTPMFRRGQPVVFETPEGATEKGWVTRSPSADHPDTYLIRCDSDREHYVIDASDVAPAVFRQVSVRIDLGFEDTVTDEDIAGFVGTLTAQVEDAVVGHDESGNERQVDTINPRISTYVDGAPLS